MLLANKVALIYGAGPIASAVAHAFAREGAQVYLAGRTQAKLEQVAAAIQAQGYTVHTAVVDALDEQAVNQFVDGVVAQAGYVDISFNLISLGDVQQPLMEIEAADFLHPITTAMRTHFLTTRAAARPMLKRGSGVILAFGGGGPQTPPGLGGFKIALGAMESLRRQWSVELGPHGIRVVTLKTGGIVETLAPDFEYREVITEALQKQALLPYTAALADVGNIAAFVASDLARTITAADVNMSCGAILD